MPASLWLDQCTISEEVVLQGLKPRYYKCMNFKKVYLLGLIVGLSHPASVVAQLTVKNACDDLFTAACLDSSGQSKKSIDNKALKSNLYKIIEEGREKTARAMGFANVNDALLEQLKKDGISFKNKINPELFDILKLKPDSEDGVDELGRQLSPDVESCYQEAERKPAPSLEQLKKQLQAKSITFRAQNLPGFLTGYFGSQCTALRDNPSDISPKDNPEIAKKCAEFPQIKRNAELLSRMEGRPEYKALSEKFVAENLLPEIKFIDPKKNERNQQDLKSRCEGFGNLVFNSARRSASKLMLRFSQNKVLVDHIVESHYSAEKKERFRKLFEETRQNVITVVGSIVTDKAKKEKIIAQYKKVKFTWPAPLPSDKYVKSKKDNQYYLDFEAMSDQQIESYAPFVSDDLSHFYESNAFYQTAMLQGVKKTDEQITMMPAFLSQLDSNPVLFAGVLGHELGHKADPNISEVNGHPLEKELKPALSCYAQANSIRMPDQQRGEVAADLYAAEVTAIKMKTFSSDAEKIDYLVRTVSGYCGFNSDENHAYHVNCKGKHPAPSMRIAGIFGANSSIRRALGCTGDSKNFKTCGLDSKLQATSSPDWLGDDNTGVNPLSPPSRPKTKLPVSE